MSTSERDRDRDRDVGVNSGSTPAAPVPLDPTGVPGLDDVLGGGIQRGSLAIIAGPPGGGKTILAHQIAFWAARTGRHTVVLTAFSEPTNKLIAHMRPFAFFDQELLGTTLDVLSVQQLLRQGLDAATNEIVATVRAAKAELVVLDGFRGVRETAEDPEEARRFIYEVSNRLNLLGITLLLTSEANVRDAVFFPEATTADVLLGLAFDVVDARERRTLEVLKMRGAAPLAGRHALTIGDEGITIYPRLEARVARLARMAGAQRPIGAPRPPSAMTMNWRGVAGAGGESAPAPERVHDEVTGSAESGAGDEAQDGFVATGVLGLDTLLDGGLPLGSSTLVVGDHGAGKTLLGLQFALAGARTGESSLFVSFRETAGQLLRKGAPFSWAPTLERALHERTLSLLRTPPVELQADVFADSLLTRLDEIPVRRLVVDEIGELEHALVASGYTHRYHDFIGALVEALRVRGVTSLLIRQSAADGRAAPGDRLGTSATATDNVFWLRQRSHHARIDRSLLLLQTSRSNYATAAGWYPVSIQAPEGMTVAACLDDDQVSDQGDDDRGRRAGRGPRAVEP